MFQVGDKVKILSASALSTGNRVTPEKSRLIGKISSISDISVTIYSTEHKYIIEGDCGGLYYFREDELELIMENEFKVGDKVKILSVSSLDGESIIPEKLELVGTTVTINEISPSSLSPEHKYLVSGNFIGLYRFREDELELAYDTKFKVGQEVKIITKQEDWKNLKIGETSRIRNVNNGGEKRYGLTGDLTYIYYEHELELVEEYTGPKDNILTNSEAFKRLNLQVGDKVKLLFAAPSYLNGWNNTWVQSKNDLIGRELTIHYVSDVCGGQVQFTEDFQRCNFPVYNLQLISRKPTEVEIDLNSDYRATVSENGVKINGTLYSKDTFEKLAKAANEVRNPVKIVELKENSAHSQAYINSNGIKVGCQKFSFEKLDQVMEELKKF